MGLYLKKYEGIRKDDEWMNEGAKYAAPDWQQEAPCTE